MSSLPVVTIVDYGMGNLGSVSNAFRYIGCASRIAADPEIVVKAECILLPGVGSFRRAMSSLRQTGLDLAILEAVRVKGTRILGICLGMQLLGTYGFEDGETPGLGLVDAQVDAFTCEEVGVRKIPHVGFDQVEIVSGSHLMAGLGTDADFYFVHSYRMLPTGLQGNISCCSYGTPFVAAIEYGNINATQFHPEKSQANGLVLLRNFVTG
ncbi:MAG: imidazole glycerol phosphate synthase subunit HisH [Verrucomicrobiota bacterium]